MKTIFVTSFHVFISRNILASPFFEIIKQQKDFRIVILVPDSKKAFFEKQYAAGNVMIEGVSRKVGRIDAFLNDFALASFTMRSAKIRRQFGIGWILWYTRYLFFFAPIFFRQYSRIYGFLMPRRRYGSLFEKYKPDLLFATDIFSPMDANMMLDAKNFHVPILGMIRSWDNLTTKGPIPVRPEVLVVNNGILKNEAELIHLFPEQKIRVVGIPHYDRYGKGPVHDRSIFLSRCGIPETKRFFVYAPQGDRFFTKGVVNTFDRDIIEIITKSLPDDYALLVRLPPADSVNITGIQIPSGRVFFDRPGIQLADDPTFYKQNELSRDDEDHLIDTLYHTDGIISVGTTLAIDGAAFDKPQIIVGFWLENRKIVSHSRIHAHDYDHMQALLGSSGVRVVKTVNDLSAAISDYVKNPLLDQQGRRELVKNQCTITDGNSSQRLFEVLRAFLDAFRN